MKNTKRVHCGEQHTTFVCQHLVHGSRLGFFEADQETISEEESDERCAWCSECEKVRAQRDGWDDVSEKFAKVTMICEACFEKSRQRNQI